MANREVLRRRSQEVGVGNSGIQKKGKESQDRYDGAPPRTGTGAVRRRKRRKVGTFHTTVPPPASLSLCYLRRAETTGQP